MASLHSASLKSQCYQFAKRMFGSKEEIKALYIRECYPSLYSKVIECITATAGDELDVERKAVGCVKITGTAGIGKTFFLIYCLIKLVNEQNVPVLFNFRGRYYFFSLQEKLPKYVSGSLLNYNGIWQGEIDIDEKLGKDLVKQLYEDANVWCLIDYDKNPIYTYQGTHKNIVASLSRNNKHVEQLGKTTEDLWVSTWNLDELEKGVGKLKELKIFTFQDDLKEKYKIHGGVPRSLFATDENAMKQLNAAFGKLGESNLKTLLNADSTLAPDVSSKLVHTTVDDKFNLVGSVFASDYIYSRLLTKFKFNRMMDEKAWVDATKGIGHQGERGIRFEQVYHQLIINGTSDKSTFNMKSLNNAEASTKEVSIKWKGIFAIAFGRNDMRDLRKLDMNCYAIPCNDNFATVDSFIVTRNSFIVPESDDLCLIQFQMTVKEKKHDTLGQKLVDIANKVDSLIDGFDKDKSPIYLVFVIESENMGTFEFQTYLTKKGEAYKEGNIPTICQRTKQFALCITNE